jgi:hypothetical protein
VTANRLRGIKAVKFILPMGAYPGNSVLAPDPTRHIGTRSYSTACSPTG